MVWSVLVLFVDVLLLRDLDFGQKFCSGINMVKRVDDVLSILFICELLIVANFKPRL